MVQHHFNIELAKRYGIAEAVIIDNFYFWIEKNRANGKFFFEGKYWTYNSVKALAELFPYLTTKQISYSIEKLVKAGVILKGNFNTSGYDRTCWYALSNDVISIYQNKEIHLPILENGVSKNGKPIPYTNTDSNTDTLGNDDVGAAPKKIPFSEIPYTKLSLTQFHAQVHFFDEEYPAEILKSFYNNWKQVNPQGKMNFQLQPVWDIEHRLHNWAEKQKEIDARINRENEKNKSRHAGANELLARAAQLYTGGKQGT